ncbi:hypothetical protein FO488_05515 [Geobacter sp. FeAm09]|uniref:hypothetical protein n=1 Tax=Geobacter sp. FeAm09 TaxID=2597769 RepID=UPI0011ED0FA5|nr:hypothetical protein [Geobacter sp. FeAm09]QEM67662.1 hypothetical protein FO488_05515 [Geobacter sp. FeAm09]
MEVLNHRQAGPHTACGDTSGARAPFGAGTGETGRERRHNNSGGPPEEGLNGVPLPASDRLACDSRYRNIIMLLDAMCEQRARQPNADLGADFERLWLTTVKQTCDEEAYMWMVGFPEQAQHSIHHQFLCTKTAEVHYRFIKGHGGQPDDLAHIRLLWLEHIQEHDRAFEAFLVS